MIIIYVYINVLKILEAQLFGNIVSKKCLIEGIPKFFDFNVLEKYWKRLKFLLENIQIFDWNLFSSKSCE